MSQTKEEIQLQVWKDLALSKQLLANEVLKALDLDSTSSATDIKDALRKLIDRANHADTNIADARKRADNSINEIRVQLRESEKARSIAEGAIDNATATREAAENALVAGRTANSDGLKKAKEEVARKDRELKAINAALADTPENVVKKLKTLKKQKHDENTARKTAEASVRTLKKEKKDVEKELEDSKKTLEQSADLVEKYRELRTVAEEHFETVKSAAADDAEITELPEQDDKLLEGIEMAAASIGDDKDSDKADKDKSKADKKVDKEEKIKVKKAS